MPVKHRNRWSRTPREGSIKNRIFRALLREEGLNSMEATEQFGEGNLQNTINALRDFCGFDIRCFTDKSRFYTTAEGRKVKHPVIYKIVGRQKWSGGYVSFIRPENYP